MGPKWSDKPVKHLHLPNVEGPPILWLVAKTCDCTILINQKGGLVEVYHARSVIWRLSGLCGNGSTPTKTYWFCKV